MTIKVTGSVKLRGNYEVELDMTEAEFDSLTEEEQNDEISTAIDWMNWLANSDTDDLDVDDIEDVIE